MSADYVEGTIKIIAEVVGNAKSPAAGTGSLDQGDDKDNEKQKRHILGIEMSMKNLTKIMGVAGILSQSKIMSSSLTTIMRLFGAFIDIILAPLAPFLVRGLVILGKVIKFIQAFLQNPWQALKDAWTGLVRWFHTTWDEQGGFWGVLKEAAASVTGLILITTMFGAMTGLISPKWFLGKIFATGKLITKSALKAALGLAKFVAWSAPKFILTKSWLALKMFGQGVLFSAGKLKALFGLARTFVGPAINAAWWGARIFGGVLVSGLSALGGLFGIVASTATLLFPFLLGVLIITAAVAAIYVLHLILERVGFYSFIADFTENFKNDFNDALDAVEDMFEGSITPGRDFFKRITGSVRLQN
jgi:hypothetical protein